MHYAKPTSQTTVEQNLAWFRIFFAVAREKGIKVVAVTSPYLMRDPDAERARKLQEHMSDLLRTEGVPYLTVDEREYPELRERRLYKDSSHLNADGALAYSRALAQKLVAQGLLP